jgi:Transmembrane family 220, helix
MKTATYALGTLFFLGCMAVQFNDHDAILWVSIYALAVILGVLSLVRRPVPILSFFAAIGYGIYASVLLYDTNGQWFDGEAEREVAGLVLSALWAAFLSRSSGRHVPPSA